MPVGGWRPKLLKLDALLVAGFAAFAAVRVQAGSDLASQVVIVCNDLEPESRPLALYYAQKRGIPTNQICGLRARPVETITRREFNEDVRDPFLRFLTRHSLVLQSPRTIFDKVLGSVPWLETTASRVSYAVLMYGVPLRIDRDPNLREPAREDLRKEFLRNDSSVESDLAVSLTYGVPVTGFVNNPYYEKVQTAFGTPLSREMLLVGRLDGPDPQVVRRMIDDALTAERYGLHGRAYFDAQGTKEPGYAKGDDWIRASWKAIREAGYECEFDEQVEILPDDYPMTDVAVYAGWYTTSMSGPFWRERFRFQPGALAYHIHSTSGASVRTRQAYWVGPLLFKGAAATMGNVWEPSLELTPHIDVFFNRLLAGGTFLEAGYCSVPVLSWQTTFVGDPLYRPFAVSLDDQIAVLEKEQRPELEWAYLRKINTLVVSSKIGEAEELCRAKADALKSDVLYEKLGDLVRVTHRNGGAIEAYRKVLKPGGDYYRFVRVAAKLATAYEVDQQPDAALRLYEQLAGAQPASKRALEFCEKARDLAMRLGKESEAQQYQAKIDEFQAAELKRKTEKQ